MDAIVFKAYLINKLINWFFPIAVAGLAVIYLKFNLNDENRTMVCAAFLGVPILAILYLNRSEPKLLKFDKENIEISYVVQPPFGKDKRVYPKNELHILKANNVITISNKTGIVAKMRRKALNTKDWKTLEHYFD
jgi:hypothetical protein